MTTLTEFLLARIAEDEAWAGAEIGRNHERAAVEAWSMGASSLIVTNGPGSPRRVLAECEAKRRIVDAHPLVTDPSRLIPVWTGLTPGVACETCAGTPVDSGAPLEDIGPCDTLLALAAVYVNHPDFRDEWR